MNSITFSIVFFFFSSSSFFLVLNREKSSLGTFIVKNGNVIKFQSFCSKKKRPFINLAHFFEIYYERILMASVSKAHFLSLSVRHSSSLSSFKSKPKTQLFSPAYYLPFSFFSVYHEPITSNACICSVCKMIARVIKLTARTCLWSDCTITHSVGVLVE